MVEPMLIAAGGREALAKYERSEPMVMTIKPTMTSTVLSLFYGLKPLAKVVVEGKGSTVKSGYHDPPWKVQRFKEDHNVPPIQEAIALAV